MKKKAKTMCKALSVFLAFLIVVQILPLQVLAENVTDAIAHKEFIEDVLKNPTPEDNVPDAEILYEVEEKRDEYTKVYKKSDGTYTAIMTEEPLHFFNHGVWEEINNSMSLNGNFYTNLENVFNVEFPESIDSNENLTVEKDGYELSFSVDNIKESSAVVENDIVVSETNISVADEVISQTQSSVTYNDVAENTDLQYIVTPNSIKENIIISNKACVNDTYTFTFETNGLNAEKLDDGGVVFKDENNEIKFRIPRPVMTDTNFAFSYDIDVCLIENADDTITLEYSPSSDWTNSSERVYPITIDPAIMVENDDVSWVEDTWVAYDSSDSGMQNGNGYNDCLAFLANQTTTDNDGNTQQLNSEIYTKFNIDVLKSLGDNIVFTEVQYLFIGASADGKALAKKIATPIDLTTVTYTTKPTLEDEIIDYYTSPYTLENDGSADFSYIHFNITKPLNEWYNGAENNGFAVVAGNEEYVGLFYLNGVQTTTSSSGTTTKTYTTGIAMDYVDMGGYNENLNYHSQSVGRAGTGYVNDFTQHLSVIRDDIYVDDEIMPVTIGMIYDSSTYDKLESLNYNSLLVYGNNWIPNYLRAYLAVDENNFTYYTDTGSTIDFTRSTDDEGNVIFTELYSDIYGNHDYELEYHPASEECDAYYIINRPDGDIEKFNEYGLLISVISSQSPEQLINVVYDSNFRIDYITDINDRKYDYIYDTTGLLSEVEVSSADGTQMTTESTNLPLEICYTYDTNGNLIGVTHSGGESIEYVYDENGNMTSMTLIDSCRAKYDYDSYGRVIKATEQSYNGTDYADRKTITYDRLSATQIKITSGSDDCKIYQFNIKGSLMYIVDSAQPVHSTLSNESNLVRDGRFQNGLQEWTTTGVSETTPATIIGQTVSAVEFPGGTDTENIIYETVSIDGKKNDTIAVSGWFKGNFTKSTTNNSSLKNTIEESDNSKICNFTNDRFAQIEVAYQYKVTDGNEEKIVEEKIAIPFSEHLDDWQYVSDGFTLRGDCETVTILIRYSNNTSTGYFSSIELVKNNGYELDYYENEDGTKSLKSMSLGLRDVISYTYNQNDKISSVEYNNISNQKTLTEFEYNNYDKVTEIKENGKTKYKLSYTNSILNSISSVDNRIIRYVDEITGLSGFNNNFFYSIKNKDGIFVENFAGKIYNTKVYDVLDDLTKITSATTEKSEVINVENSNGIEIQSTQDWLGKRSNNIVEAKENCGTDSENVLVKVESQYGYDENADFETLNQVKIYTNTIRCETQINSLPNNMSFFYEYDENGNIIEEYDYISENSMELRYSYAYDSNNRLIRYNDNVSIPNRSYSYEYDSDGNLVSKSTYTYTPLETELGEPLATEYYNVASISLNDATLVWNGQQLESYERIDDNNITTRVEYSYDENGLITEKKVYIDNVLNEKYNYTWAYGQLINQIYTGYEDNEETTYAIKYVYDSFNTVQGFIFNHSETYLYLKNLQGDIVGIVDKTGNIVVSYEYDVWGVPTVTLNNDIENTLANIIETLPLAYRGCCYDYDTGLYYVENRYYNPEIGRFINASGAEDNGLSETEPVDNLFTYWRNHPSWYIDYDANESYLANSIANYLYNQQLTNDLSNYYETTNGFIFNQKDEIGIKNYRFGYNTIGPVGCGLVATYNALLLLGDKMEFYDVIREFETNGVMLQGCCGTHPLAIVQFFTKRGYDVNIAFNNFDDIADNENIVNIMYYKHSYWEHYVTIKYEDESFKGYNTFCKNSNVDNLGDSIATLADNTYKGLMLISISQK